MGKKIKLVGEDNKDNIENEDIGFVISNIADPFIVLDQLCLEEEENEEIVDVVEDPKDRSRSQLEDILYKVPIIKDPLIGCPKKTQLELDRMVVKIQKDPDSQESERLYDKIHLYMHKYLISVPLKQFPYIRGMQTVDVYQESLIALKFKAIPGFQMNKGMSFLNFAKLCIRRHLITLLNASKNRQKDQTINRSISLDTPVMSDDDSNNTLSNIVPDTSPSVDKMTESKEAIDVTKQKLVDTLSDFEQEVLVEYLNNSSYRDIAIVLVQKHADKIDTNLSISYKKMEKAVDNALLRIRKKAITMKLEGNDELPLFN